MASQDVSPELRFEEERIRRAYAKRETSRYSHFNPAHSLTVHEIEIQLLELLRRKRRTNLSGLKILEVGCGSGHWLRRMIEWGAAPANVFGVDLLDDRIAAAREISPQNTNLICTSATELDFRDAEFDIVSQFIMFSSILDRPTKKKIAEEMLRVVKPAGLIIWFDYFVSNPRNPDVRGIAKNEITELFPGSEVSLKRVLLAPPIARAIAPYSQILCSALSRVPLLCTHYMGTIQKCPDQETPGNGG
jgi:ubiquinone/menaquinone biosynthesis C-methylase UbiE